MNENAALKALIQFWSQISQRCPSVLIAAEDIHEELNSAIQRTRQFCEEEPYTAAFLLHFPIAELKPHKNLILRTFLLACILIHRSELTPQAKTTHLHCLMLFLMSHREQDWAKPDWKHIKLALVTTIKKNKTITWEDKKQLLGLIKSKPYYPGYWMGCVCHVQILSATYHLINFHQKHPKLTLYEACRKLSAKILNPVFHEALSHIIALLQELQIGSPLKKPKDTVLLFQDHPLSLAVAMSQQGKFGLKKTKSVRLDTFSEHQVFQLSTKNLHSLSVEYIHKACQNIQNENPRKLKLIPEVTSPLDKQEFQQDMMNITEEALYPFLKENPSYRHALTDNATQRSKEKLPIVTAFHAIRFLGIMNAQSILANHQKTRVLCCAATTEKQRHAIWLLGHIAEQLSRQVKTKHLPTRFSYLMTAFIAPVLMAQSKSMVSESSAAPLQSKPIQNFFKALFDLHSDLTQSAYQEGQKALKLPGTLRVALRSNFWPTDDKIPNSQQQANQILMAALLIAIPMLTSEKDTKEYQKALNSSLRPLKINPETVQQISDQLLNSGQLWLPIG
ncbi:hypothetical protein [Algicola sagamiensis]|uniref:hypothetical protein n=1 Tax=Algicola sagamiensis TaxID=163869 RepID=UPI00035CF105|nr:hypothetical protein [Algicola sagamiensis]